jgi:hypothetical protein
MRNVFSKQDFFRILLLVLSIAGLLFWWFSYRPQAVKRHCFYSTGDDGTANIEKFDYYHVNDKVRFVQKSMSQYEKCLRSRGF